MPTSVHHLFALTYNYTYNWFILGAQNVGVNPKVNNMMNGYEAAQYPLLLISDASVRSRS